MHTCRLYFLQFQYSMVFYGFVPEWIKLWSTNYLCISCLLFFKIFMAQIHFFNNRLHIFVVFKQIPDVKHTVGQYVLKHFIDNFPWRDCINLINVFFKLGKDKLWMYRLYCTHLNKGNSSLTLMYIYNVKLSPGKSLFCLFRYEEVLVLALRSGQIRFDWIESGIIRLGPG